MRKLFFTILLALLSFIGVRADEGMWIPLLLEKYTIADMQQKGFKLTAEDIYSVNKACMKDAVMIFGGGCTGELVSDSGLIFTNHHCGFDAIQKLSTLANNFLADGYWAKQRTDELPCVGLSVEFLVRMEDVTNQVFAGIGTNSTEQEKQKIRKKNISEIEKRAISGTKYKSEVKPFYNGNEYYLFISEVFNDIRFVAAPPVTIGKFGGDTDNWVWPRHTADFSMFRIYANKNNQPAPYSAENVPYRPKKFFNISLKGVKKDDFTMVLGYPGRTSEYLPSYTIDFLVNEQNPARIKLRQTIIDTWGADMSKSEDINLKYAAKYYGVSNGWKKWIGQNRGLKQANAVNVKRQFEGKFYTWVNSSEMNKKYANILPDYARIYNNYKKLAIAEDYIYEGFFGIEAAEFAANFRTLALITKDSSDVYVNQTIKKLQDISNNFFKDYNLLTDKKLCIGLLTQYYEDIDKQYQPEIFREIEKKHKGSIALYVNYLYERSILVDQTKLNNYLTGFKPSSVKKLLNDPLYLLYLSVVELSSVKIYPITSKFRDTINTLNRLYMSALREMQTDKKFYPDANFSLRVTYGKVSDYFPMDGVRYEYFTTLKGMIEKEDSTIADYKVAPHLKELYKAKNYGDYAENGELHIAFIATNHTSGGNSGSPVINAEGQLIGINFDRNWEGTMSDIMYDPNQCRNIALDVRYVLFMLDKYANAKRLLNELVIVR